MHAQTAEHWERKAAQARNASCMLKGDNGRATMLEMAGHYEKLALQARINARKPTRPNDAPS